MNDHWSVETRGIQFGDGTDFPWQDSGPELFGWGSLRTSDQEYADRDGFATGGPDRLSSKSRKMTLPFWALAGSTGEVQYLYERFATAWAPGDLEIILRTPDRVFTVYGRARDVSMPNAKYLRSDHIAPCAVQITLTDPNLYGTEVVTEIGLGGTPAGTGLQFPFRFPFRFGPTSGVTGAGVAQLDNVGNRDTGLAVLFHSQAGITGPAIARFFTQDVIRFPNLTIQPGWWLLVDTARKTAVVQPSIESTAGQQSVKHEIDWSASRWFELPPGPSTVVVAGNGTGSGVTVHRPAFLI